MEVEKILGVLKTLTKDDFNNINSNAADGIKKIMEQMEEEIRKNNNKKCGKGNVSKAAMEIIAQAKKFYSETVSNKLGAYTDTDGKQYICDGYRLMVLNNRIDLPENESPDHIDCKKLVKSTKGLDTIDIPNLAELKSALKELKANKQQGAAGYNARLENNQVVDLKFLINAVTAFGDGNYKCYVGKQLHNPIIFKNKEVYLMILPIRDDGKHEGMKYFVTNKYGK